MASITKTKSGTYRARVNIKSANGKFRQKGKSGFRTKTEAKHWAAAVESQKMSDDYGSQSSALLSDYFYRWASIYKKDKESATVYQYENTYRTIVKYIPRARIDTFNRSQFQSFINDFGKTHSRQTVMKRKNHISQCLRDAYADGIIKRDPTIRIIGAGNDGKTAELKFLEADELLKLDSYVSQRLSIPSYLAIYIAIHTGMRYGEIAALESDDLDRTNHTLSITKSIDKDGRVKGTKTEKSNRVIKIDDGLYNALEPINGRYVSVSSTSVNKSLRHALDELGAKPITFHGLRHSHASFLLTKGVNINYVSERLGHANIAITQKVYAHLLNEQREVEEEKTISLFD